MEPSEWACGRADDEPKTQFVQGYSIRLPRSNFAHVHVPFFPSCFFLLSLLLRTPSWRQTPVNFDADCTLSIDNYLTTTPLEQLGRFSSSACSAVECVLSNWLLGNNCSMFTHVVGIDYPTFCFERFSARKNPASGVRPKELGELSFPHSSK